MLRRTATSSETKKERNHKKSSDSFLSMEMIGFEPTASAVQVRRSPN